MSTGLDPFPVLLTLQVATASLLLATPIGIALAFCQARFRYRLSAVVDAVILLPLVLPPSVVGYFLVALLGRRGPVGSWLAANFDLTLIFTPAAAVIASTIVALPLFAKTAQPAIEAVPREQEDVARTLGLGPVQVLLRVTIPSAWRGIAAAMALAFARAAGEFGATLMFAGNIPGRTNTMPLEIYAAYQSGHDERALLYVVILSTLSCLVVFLSSRLGPGGDK
ncbi:MAG: molybdate ABC transporter permease subunit [Deltaproteobacteria bacterium]